MVGGCIRNQPLHSIIMTLGITSVLSLIFQIGFVYAATSLQSQDDKKYHMIPLVRDTHLSLINFFISQIVKR
jgi:hypothetical protein